MTALFKANPNFVVLKSIPFSENSAVTNKETAEQLGMLVGFQGLLNQEAPSQEPCLSTCIRNSMDAVYYGQDPSEEIALLKAENERLRRELEFFRESACKLKINGTK